MRLALRYASSGLKRRQLRTLPVTTPVELTPTFSKYRNQSSQSTAFPLSLTVSSNFQYDIGMVLSHTVRPALLQQVAVGLAALAFSVYQCSMLILTMRHDIERVKRDTALLTEKYHEDMAIHAKQREKDGAAMRHLTQLSNTGPPVRLVPCPQRRTWPLCSNTAEI